MRITRGSSRGVVLAVLSVLLGTCVHVSAQQGALDKIVSKGKIVVGMALDEPPYSFLDKSGKPAGFQYEVAKMLADELGVQIEIVETPPASRIVFLQTNKVDLIVSTFTRTLKRALVVDFSIPYFSAGTILVVKKPSGIRGVADLKGKSVGCVRASTHYNAIVKAAKDATIRQFEYASDTYLALDQGKVDALATDINRARWLKKEQKQNYDILLPILFPEYIAIGVKKNNDDLLNWVNLYLQELHESGKSAELYEKHLGEKPAAWIIPWSNAR